MNDSPIDEIPPDHRAGLQVANIVFVFIVIAVSIATTVLTRG